jgi:hypothetical protein
MCATREIGALNGDVLSPRRLKRHPALQVGRQLAGLVEIPGFPSQGGFDSPRKRPSASRGRPGRGGATPVRRHLTTLLSMRFFVTYWPFSGAYRVI